MIMFSQAVVKDGAEQCTFDHVNDIGFGQEITAFNFMLEWPLRLLCAEGESDMRKLCEICPSEK